MVFNQDGSIFMTVIECFSRIVFPDLKQSVTHISRKNFTAVWQTLPVNGFWFKSEDEMVDGMKKAADDANIAWDVIVLGNHHVDVGFASNNSFLIHAVSPFIKIPTRQEFKGEDLLEEFQRHTVAYI
jgi:hypothetical protein